MPSISKQKRLGNPKTSNGSILASGIDVADLEEDYIKILLYGQNRVGKTTLACQFPKPLALVSFEPNKTGGAISVKRIPGVILFRTRASADALKLAKELRDENHGFKSVVLDSATSYQDVILKEILNLSELPEQLNWGMISQDQYRQRSEKTKECLRPFLNLDMHVVVTAKEKDHNPPLDRKEKSLKKFQLESWIAADLGTATVQWLHDACDYLARLYLDKEIVVHKRRAKIAGKEKEWEEEEETGKIVRRLRTLYHPNYAAGFRSCTPESIPEYIENPTFEKIQKLIKGA